MNKIITMLNILLITLLIPLSVSAAQTPIPNSQGVFTKEVKASIVSNTTETYGHKLASLSISGTGVLRATLSDASYVEANVNPLFDLFVPKDNTTGVWASLAAVVILDSTEPVVGRPLVIPELAPADPDAALHLPTAADLDNAKKVLILNKAANYNLTAWDVKEVMVVASATMTATYPSAVVIGGITCITSGTGLAAPIGFNPGAGHQLDVDGVLKTAATTYASTGVLGDSLCVIGVSSTVLKVLPGKVGTWSE